MIGSKILLVDDEEVFASNMEKLLKDRGYWVKAVNSGYDALEVLEKQDFDVVVLDMRMHGLDGISTLREIKKMGLFTQVLMLTGHGSIGTAKEALMLGAYDYLTKPCEIDELVEKIEGAWKEKDKNVKEELNENIKKIVESPSSVFGLYPKK
ncbi:MAG: response regulator [Proteobacteria bacterium]|nr:response regulator [Pseudomonadota bacterium]MBU4471662.1 response regulator [Pseudomonadota bacterium]MCG2751143.1 response regulator [Desulfobacteraceae bacterium]